MTAEQTYKKNKKKAKVYKALAPAFYWLFTGLAVLFFVLMIKNSLGNIFEIFDMLDKKTLTGEVLAENYAYLVEKWGEWTIVGANGAGFRVQFIDIRNAMFGGVMVTYMALTIVSFILSLILGKLLFPKLAQLYKDVNDDMVDLATLETNAQMKKKNKDGGWF